MAASLDAGTVKHAWWQVEGLPYTSHFTIDEESATRGLLSSAIPTPEEALLAAEEGEDLEDDEPQWTDEQLAEVSAALAVAHPIDREIYFLAEIAGLGQVDIGSRVGLSQPSISNRLIALRSWLARVVPRRIAVRRLLGGELAPSALDALDAQLFVGIFWRHETQTGVGHQHGHTQGCVRHRWLRLWGRADVELRRHLPRSTVAWRRPMPLFLDRVEDLRRWERSLVNLLDGVEAECTPTTSPTSSPNSTASTNSPAGNAG